MFLAGRAMPSGHVAGPDVDDYGQALIDIGVSFWTNWARAMWGSLLLCKMGGFWLSRQPRASAMLARSENLIDADAGPAVFVKMQKSGQDHRLDKPFVGAETMRAASTAGIMFWPLNRCCHAG